MCLTSNNKNLATMSCWTYICWCTISKVIPIWTDKDRNPINFQNLSIRNCLFNFVTEIARTSPNSNIWSLRNAFFYLRKLCLLKFDKIICFKISEGIAFKLWKKSTWQMFSICNSCRFTTLTLLLPFPKKIDLKYFGILFAETQGVFFNKIEHKYTWIRMNTCFK